MQRSNEIVIFAHPSIKRAHDWISLWEEHKFALLPTTETNNILTEPAGNIFIKFIDGTGCSAVAKRYAIRYCKLLSNCFCCRCGIDMAYRKQFTSNENFYAKWIEVSVYWNKYMPMLCTARHLLYNFKCETSEDDGCSNSEKRSRFGIRAYSIIIIITHNGQITKEYSFSSNAIRWFVYWNRCDLCVSLLIAHYTIFHIFKNEYIFLYNISIV